MTNSGTNLREDGNNLVKLNYSDILKKILEVLQSDKSQELFKVSDDGKRLLMNVDEIAYQVACLPIESLFTGRTSGTKCASINFLKGLETQFGEQLHTIQDRVKFLLQEALPKQENQTLSIQEYIDIIAKPLENFKNYTDKEDKENKKKDNKAEIGFNYTFEKQYTNLQKQRLTLPKDNLTIPPLLRLHKLTITVKKPTSFVTNLKSSLENFINEEERFDKDQIDNLQYILNRLFEGQEKVDNDIYLLKNLMIKEALGKLKKAAKIKYLEFLYEQVKDNTDAVYLEDLIKRLKIIEAYINDESKPDNYYKVCYQGVCVDYQEFFNNSYAFDMLPIIPQIEGYLGEINDQEKEKQEFIYGLKLKLNGQVQTEGGINSFDYYLNHLDLDSKENQEKLANDIGKEKLIKKVLRIVFLYHFIFASRGESSKLKYDPQSHFELEILPILQDSSDQDKKELFITMIEGFNAAEISVKLNKIKLLLTKNIENKKQFKSQIYPLKISLSAGLLEKEIENIENNYSLFKPGLNTKQALKYISINDSPVNPQSLCSLTVDMKITDIQYFPTEEKQYFTMNYDLKDINTIPMVLVPKEDLCRKLYKERLKENTPLVCFYNHERLKQEIFNTSDNPKAFWYQITFALLKYISLKILLDNSKNELFIPLLRLHLTTGEDTSQEENFMRSYSYLLFHLFNEKHYFSSQGIRIKNVNTFKIKNSLSSLYSILPKVFKFDKYTPELSKLAIIVVSSWECDRPYQNGYKIVNMMGEVICLYRQNDNTIRLYNRGTFSNNYDTNQIYKNPDVLIDKVNELYKDGYRHFLYVAKSPYSSYLNITGTDRELFFMSPDIIKALKGNRKDIKIYPVFFDKYYVVKLKELKATSLYIQDTSELTQLVKDLKDSSQKSIVFFNLFNGITVPGGEKYYNGVISYSTLLNIYEEIEHETDIHTGLIDDGQLKTDLLNYLTLFHFSRYEAALGKINLKLDPYQKLIGNDSVGALSIFKHSNSNIDFNCLAFLTEVRGFLNINPDNEETELCQN